MSKRSAIIVIDLLKGFFKKNPTLPDPLEAPKLFATVRRVIDAGRREGVNIVFIKDNFLPEEVPIDKHFKIYGPHCVMGTPDAEVVDELDPKPGDFQISQEALQLVQFDAARCGAARVGRPPALHHRRVDRGLRPAHRGRCVLSEL